MKSHTFKFGMFGILCLSILIVVASWVISDDFRPVLLAFIGGVVFHGSLVLLVCIYKKKEIGHYVREE
jgi:hypothetical protein